MTKHFDTAPARIRNCLNLLGVEEREFLWIEFAKHVDGGSAAIGSRAQPSSLRRIAHATDNTNWPSTEVPSLLDGWIFFGWTLAWDPDGEARRDQRTVRHGCSGGFLATSGHYIEAAVTAVFGAIALATRVGKDRFIEHAIADDRRRLEIVETPPEIRQAAALYARRAALQTG